MDETGVDIVRVRRTEDIGGTGDNELEEWARRDKNGGDEELEGVGVGGGDGGSASSMVTSIAPRALTASDMVDDKRASKRLEGGADAEEDEAAGRSASR